MRKVLLLAVAVLVSMAMTGCSTRSIGANSSGSSADGQTVLNTKCSRCHSLDRVEAARKTASAWEATVTRMQGHGLQISGAEKQAVVAYLASNFGQ